MTTIDIRRTPHFIIGLISLCFATGQPALAEVHIPPGDNSRVKLLDVQSQGQTARVLYATYPDRGDPRFGQRCALSVYELTVRPGLQMGQAVTLTDEVCDLLGLHGSLLPGQQVVLASNDGIGHWQDGQKVSQKSVSEVPGLQTLDIDFASGAHFADLDGKGSVVISWVDRGSGAAGQASIQVVSAPLIPGASGLEAWRATSAHAASYLSVNGVWAGQTGGALLHLTLVPAESGSISQSELLLPITPGGKLGAPIAIAEDRQPTLAEQAAVGGDMEKMREMLQGSYAESIRNLAVKPRTDGGFDVLINRAGGTDERDGHQLLQVGPEGMLAATYNLNQVIELHGLGDWADFQVEGETLILLSSVSATQPGIQASRSKYQQNVVGWIPINGGQPVARLLPLNRQYLEAVMNARDEQLQTIADRPGGPPLAVTTLGGLPLGISETYRSRRFVLDLAQATDDLAQYTEAFEEHQAKIAKQEAREARSAARDTRQADFNAQIAEAAGMTPEEFSKLSNREQKEQMLRHGDMEAMMAAAMQQAAAMQEAMAAAGQGGAGMPPEAAAAMQQAMAAMGNMQGGVPQNAAPGAGAVSAQDIPAEDLLEVGGNGRAFVEFDSPDGQPVTLLIESKSDSRELLRKTYPDGSVYENVDFNAFAVPLEQITVKFLAPGGATLDELVPRRK